MTVRYEYKDFPGNKKLTKKSKKIGYYTGTPGMILFGIFIFLIDIFLIFLLFGEEESDSPIAVLSFIVLFVLSMYGLHRLLIKYRDHAYQKLTKKYIQELEKLQQTNPAEFAKIMRELNR